MTRLCALCDPGVPSYVSHSSRFLSASLLPQHSVLGNNVVLLLQTFPQLVAAALLLWFLWRATTCRYVCLASFRSSARTSEEARSTSYVVGI